MESAASLFDPSLALFDQFSRYASTAEALAASFGAGDSPTVLDVGSGEARLLGKFLPQARVTYLDPLLTGAAAGDVLPGTVDQLRQSERCWDWTLAVDTLEHVPPEDRHDFLDIMMARAGRGVVVAAPFLEDRAAVEVDDEVNAAFRSKTGRDYSWLIEHASFGLPSLQETRARLEAAGLRTMVVGNGHAPWLQQLLALFVCYLDEPEHVVAFRELSRMFNERLYRYDHLEPVYRRILVACRDDAPVRPQQLADSVDNRDRAAVVWRAYWRDAMAVLSNHADHLVARIKAAEDYADPRLPGLERRCEELEGQAVEQLARGDELSEELKAKGDQLQESEAVARYLGARLEEMEQSWSWRATGFLRSLARPLRGGNR